MKATRLFLLLLFIPLFAFPQDSDTTPPTLTSLAFLPTSIDTTAAPQTVVVTLTATDDLAGGSYACVGFVSPSGNQRQYDCENRNSSTPPLDGTYTLTLTFPQFVESGTWKIEHVSLYDYANNWGTIFTADLAAEHFPTDLPVTSNPDTTPPVLKSIVFTAPTPIDATSGAVTVVARFEVTDDLSGVDMAGNSCGPCLFWTLTVGSPSTLPDYPKQVVYVANDMMTQVDSTKWDATFKIPQFAEPGSWVAYTAEFHDNAGNRRWYDAAALQAIAAPLEVTCANPDIAPPVLTNLTITPTFINTSLAQQDLTLDLSISDDRSGVDFSPDTPHLMMFVGSILRSPSGGQRAWFWGNNLISGDPLSGVWEESTVIPRYAEAGTWTIEEIDLKDTATNRRRYTTADLTAAGIPTTVTVIKPSLVIDGTVDATGATIVDQTFGQRAQLIVPPNVLTRPTEVSIDVLTEPLAIPAPTGYEATGTYYVNIELNPMPSFPLPAPGLTLVLPLVNPRAPGDTVYLFSVNPADSSLVPVSANGIDPLAGTVDASGMSATFTGVLHMSTFVGFFPLSTTMKVAIDIKPGEAIPTINPKSSGTTPVAILGSITFNPVTMVNRLSLTFGHSGSEASLSKCNPGGEDVNGDGRLDLVCHFTTSKSGFLSGDTKGVLRGRTNANVAFEGSDTIRVK